MHEASLVDISQSQNKHLSHIDFRVCFLGTIGRNDFVSRFGIKAAAATRDITLYKELTPGNLEYDTKAKVYTRSKGFDPICDYSPNQSPGYHCTRIWIDFVGPHKGFIACETPAQLNKPSLSTMSVLTRTIHQEKATRITYRSMSNERTTHEIVTIVLVDNELRWNVRAYDRRQLRFSDFVFTSIVDPVIIDSLIQTNKFILSIVIVDGDSFDRPYYIRNPFTREPDFGVTSINYVSISCLPNRHNQAL